jgi:predicted nuclease with TOPRIM domain
LKYTTQKEELMHRLKAKQKEIEAHIERLKADTSDKARRAQSQLKEKLARLQTSLKDGWDNLTEETAARLNDLLEDDETTEQAGSA